MIGELAATLARDGVELRLAAPRAPAVEMLRRSGLAARLASAPTIDAALETVTRPGDDRSPGASARSGASTDRQERP